MKNTSNRNNSEFNKYVPPIHSLSREVSPTYAKLLDYIQRTSDQTLENVKPSMTWVNSGPTGPAPPSTL